MVTELVGDIDLDLASAAGVIEPGVAEEAVLQLTAEERQELTRLLKAELQRAKS
jgi:DNA-binding GntR family transcriptional regulator